MLSPVHQYADSYQRTSPVSPGDIDSSAETTKRNKSEAATSDQAQDLHLNGKPVSETDKRDVVELSREAEEVRTLQMRDREVRAHEAAHAAAGGAYAGSPTYSFERGPDGRIYATGGSVSIDLSPIPGDPMATLQKAQQVRSAALAPAEPSGQDMKVAQKALSMAAEARSEIARQRSDDMELSTSGGLDKENAEGDDNKFVAADSVSESPSQSSAGADAPSISHLSIYS
ncbi:putative metalloprotease CJM1_0395 family protein [uncultured Desulfuromusa sp.]|uniref:putative metalloprotease CJM1_0395 family protein n=1 Tax=uncultured Desulfuromusa sp. TaxID=219183 RepID=UPI002AA6D470|nr:putative metalloprotease CJM1_0395 family protein [uncultured Desulfuromusa sp.]